MANSNYLQRIIMIKKILPGHGSGGKLMSEIIHNVIRSALGEDVQLDDSALLDMHGEKIAFTTDTFTITPIFFPGGDIGKLAVSGTVNDLSVMGAVPMYMSCALILEEGFEIDSLQKILSSMKSEADYAEIKIVTGDTKVVPQKKGDKIYINTTGMGIIEQKPQRREIEPGDKIIINGTIGDHGISVMALRNNLSFSKGLESDCTSLNHLIKKITDVYPGSIKFMRDPTRGGIASVLNEIVKGKKFGARLHSMEKLPIKDEVKGVSEILGIDPLYAANEGKVIMIVRSRDADSIIREMKDIKEGINAGIIGEISNEFPARACIDTAVGGQRILPLLIEEQLPRIC
jgi:hydrogenase expression/formation protein HypE